MNASARIRTAGAALFAVAAIALLALALAGGASGAPRGTVEVRLDEWFITTGTAEVEEGPVTFQVRNTGRTEHELLVVRTELPADKIPLGLHGPAARLAGKIVVGRDHATKGHSSAQARKDHIAPGASKTVRAVLEPGRYVLLCSIGTHYLQGQRAALTVVRAGRG